MVTEVKRKTAADYGIRGEVCEVLGILGYEPTGIEQAEILKGRERFKAIVGGDQSGKSLTTSADATIQMLGDSVAYPGAGKDETLLYWLVAEDYERTRAEFGYISENLAKLGLPVEASKRLDPGEIMVRMKGGKRPLLVIKTKSAKDPRTLAMEGPHGIIVCEAAQVALETFQRCLARVGPRRGWLRLSGSYEGSLGWYPGLIKAWAYGNREAKSYRLPTPSNWHLYPGGEQDPELLLQKANSSDAWYLERVMGIASPPKGMVFSEFRPDVHVRPCEYDPMLPVYIWEDPGYGHAHAIEIAQVHSGGQIQVFDEIYERGVITEDMIKMCTERPWWKNPNKKLVIDPHYKDQHAANRSVADIWRAAGLIPAHNPKVRITDGTERLKSYLKLDINGVPKIIFDPKCKGVLSEVGVYPNPFDGQTKVYQWKMSREGDIIGDEPDDKNNDGLKAVIYGLVEEFGLAGAGWGGKLVTMKW